ncbi:MAG TPA: S9 family peptidase [Bryobacteraceae bacterium]|nr:S9 family peptidase [Bryobacteraceae bacterium]
MMRLPRLFVFSLSLIPACLGARFGLEHTGKIVRISDPQISVDGKSVALVVERANYEENRFDSELALIEISGKSQRVLTRARRTVRQPRWSPDGSRIGFLAAVEGRQQLFVLPAAGGEAWQVTRTPAGVQQYAWRPGGKEIAFVTEDEAPKLSGEERHNKSFEVQNNHFLLTARPLSSHLWIVAAEGGPARRLTSGKWTVAVSLPPSPPSSPIGWSPDGRRIAIVKIASPYSGDMDQSSIATVDADSGEMRQVTGRSRHVSQPVFSPDGRRLAHWFPRDGETRNVNEIYVGPSEGGESASVTRTLDRNVQRAIWMPDGKSLLVSANDGTTTGLWIQPLDGKPRRIDTGPAVASASFWLDASVGPHGEIAFTASEPNHPTELYFLASIDGKPRRLTDFNAPIAALELGRSETVRWKNEGFDLDGVATYPPGFSASKKYPLVLYIHGGPRSASKAGFSSRAQLLAAQGWIVFEPNYRGSDNLGNAFQAAIWNDAGAGPGRDVMTGVAELEKRGFVDAGRRAVSGWSYGGFMTTWLLGNYPDRWKAAVAGAAVTDLTDQYNLGDSNVRRGASIGGSPWTDSKRMESYRSQSPMTYASSIKAPTLILSNTGDYRVTITQSYRLYHALRDNGVDTQFIAYPLGGHSPTDPVHLRDVDRRWVDWLTARL